LGNGSAPKKGTPVFLRRGKKENLHALLGKEGDPDLFSKKKGGKDVLEEVPHLSERLAVAGKKRGGEGNRVMIGGVANSANRGARYLLL